MVHRFVLHNKKKMFKQNTFVLKLLISTDLMFCFNFVFLCESSIRADLINNFGFLKLNTYIDQLFKFGFKYNKIKYLI